VITELYLSPFSVPLHRLSPFTFQLKKIQQSAVYHTGRTSKENGYLSYIIPRLAHTHDRAESRRHRRRDDTGQGGADSSFGRPTCRPRARGTRGSRRAAASGIGAAALARQPSTAGGAAARERGIEEEAAMGKR